jgi:hypothetical protein
VRRRNDLGAFYQDVYRALNYVPPANDEQPHTSDLHAGTRANGGKTYWYWSCSCGAGRVYDDLGAAAFEHEGHRKVHP